MAQQLLILVLVLLPLLARTQTIQDSWTAPATPNLSTKLQLNAPFTITWKASLTGSFNGYCNSCDITKLDLWVTSWQTNDYNSKIAGSVNINTTRSYSWPVSVSPSDLAKNNQYVFRFTPYGAQPPFNGSKVQQVSSAGFEIEGGVQPSSSAVTSASGTPSSVQSSSVASSNSASSTSNTLPSPTPSPESKSKAWIAGVVIGPIVGIALGAALMWFLLKKRRAKQSQPGPGYDQSVYPSGQAPAEKYAQAGTYAPVSPQPGEQWQHQPGSYGQYPVEAPGSTPVPPAELSQGNYHSKP